MGKIRQIFSWLGILFLLQSAAVLAGGQRAFSDIPVWYPVDGYAKTLRVADFNGDGFDDAVTLHWEIDGREITQIDPPYETMEIGTVGLVAVRLYDKANHRFGAAQYLKVGKSCWYHCAYENDLAIGDYNGDHFPDLFVLNAESMTISIFLNDGTGHFPSTPNLQEDLTRYIPIGGFGFNDYAEYSHPFQIVVGDFQGGTAFTPREKADIAVRYVHSNGDCTAKDEGAFVDRVIILMRDEKGAYSHFPGFQGSNGKYDVTKPAFLATAHPYDGKHLVFKIGEEVISGLHYNHGSPFYTIPTEPAEMGCFSTPARHSQKSYYQMFADRLGIHPGGAEHDQLFLPYVYARGWKNDPSDPRLTGNPPDPDGPPCMATDPSKPYFCVPMWGHGLWRWDMSWAGSLGTSLDDMMKTIHNLKYKGLVASGDSPTFGEYGALGYGKSSLIKPRFDLVAFQGGLRVKNMETGAMVVDPAGIRGDAVALEDLDHDGHADMVQLRGDRLVVAYGDGSSIHPLVGKVAEWSSEHVPLPWYENPVRLLLGNFNGDTEGRAAGGSPWRDIAVLSSGGIAVYYNLGDGQRFRPIITEITPPGNKPNADGSYPKTPVSPGGAYIGDRVTITGRFGVGTENQVRGIWIKDTSGRLIRSVAGAALTVTAGVAGADDVLSFNWPDLELGEYRISVYNDFYESGWWFYKSLTDRFPRVTKVDPDTQEYGQIVDLIGYNFGVKGAADRVVQIIANGNDAQTRGISYTFSAMMGSGGFVIADDGKSIRLDIPNYNPTAPKWKPGKYLLTLTMTSGRSTSVELTLQPDKPIIETMTNPVALKGTVTITGQRFGAGTPAVIDKIQLFDLVGKLQYEATAGFGAGQFRFDLTDDNKIYFVLPATGLAAGKYKLVMHAGDGRSSDSFDLEVK